MLEYRVASLAPGNDRTVGGIVVRYGSRAQVAGLFTESFVPGSLRPATRGVMLNLQHDRARLLARTGAGLTLEDGRESMEMRADLPNTTLANDVLEGVRAGLYTGLSIEFRAEEESWEGNHRTVHKAVMSGVSIVDVPAYSDSHIGEMREAFFGENRVVRFPAHLRLV